MCHDVISSVTRSKNVATRNIPHLDAIGFVFRGTTDDPLAIG